MSSYNDTFQEKTRHLKNPNKMRLHKPHAVSEKDKLAYSRAMAKKDRVWVKNFKRQQAIRRLMHCHPEQPSENDDYYDDDYTDYVSECGVLDRFDDQDWYELY
jgi:hypothetical protein